MENKIHIDCPRCGSTKLFSLVKTKMLECTSCHYGWEELRIHPTVDVCDFCSSSNITKDYACENFEVFNISNVQANSCGMWAACAECAALIDTDKWYELSVRGLLALPKPPQTEREAEILLGIIRKMHQEFRARRFHAN